MRDVLTVLCVLYFLGRPDGAKPIPHIDHKSENLRVASDHRQNSLVSQVDKKSSADQLVARFERLTNAERRQLVKLAPVSYQPLLARYMQVVTQYDATAKKNGHNTTYRLIRDVEQYLAATYNKEDRTATVAALSTLSKRSLWRSVLDQLVQDRDDPSGRIPALIKQLRGSPLKDRWQSDEFREVSRSTHPAAVAFMIRILRDPKALPAWRHEAFIRLAGTGGKVGIEAVRRARAKPSPITPWYDQLDLARLHRDALMNVRRDSKRRTWALFQSPILGNNKDLFIVEKIGSKWGRPLFTGAWTENEFRHSDPLVFRGIPVAKLVASEWIRTFTDDAEIRRDSDGDGLTDVVEARLGTDPHKADTDGDGLSDLVDPCPNAARRPLGDEDKIIAACIEAGSFGFQWRPPAVVSIEGVKPFELVGYRGIVIWRDQDALNALAEQFGNGVNLIHFQEPRMSGMTRGFIHFNSDRKTAYTIITQYQDPESGTGVEVKLEKFGNEWFVVDMVQRFVS